MHLPTSLQNSNFSFSTNTIEIQLPDSSKTYHLPNILYNTACQEASFILKLMLYQCIGYLY